MKFSLILCTVNRTSEVKELLNSLSKQNFKNFEVVVVDQNSDDKVKKLLSEYEFLEITYLKSELGLSKARNIGLRHCTGDIVCFPDDDCSYPENLLTNVQKFFSENGYHVLMGKTIDKDTNQIVAGKNCTINKELSSYYTLGSSTTLFVRRTQILEFDEEFGLGARFGAEEENDLVFRLLKLGCKGYYAPDINFVFHPPSDLDFTDLRRVGKRSEGLGAFIAKHLFTFEGAVYFCKYNLTRPLLGSILFFLKGDSLKAKYYISRWLGIWRGFLSYLFF